MAEPRQKFDWVQYSSIPGYQYRAMCVLLRLSSGHTLKQGKRTGRVPSEESALNVTSPRVHEVAWSLDEQNVA